MRVLFHITGRLVVGLLVFTGLRASAGPGEGVRLGAWMLSPYLGLNLTDDSNIFKEDQFEKSDMYFEPEIGLRFSSTWETNRLNLRGNAFYSDRNYDTYSTEDFNSYGDSVALQYMNERGFQAKLIQSYRKLNDLDRHYADIDETSNLRAGMVEDNNALDLRRDLNQLGASLSRRLTDKLELGLSYRYSGVDYENSPPSSPAPGELEVPPGLDLDGHILQFDAALGLTDKTDATLVLHQGLQNQEGMDGSADLTTLRLGLRTRGSDKLEYWVGAGLERYVRPPEMDDDANLTFSFNGEVDWFITEKLTFRCGGFNGTQFSSFYFGNAMEYTMGWAGLGYRWKPSTIFSLRGVYRWDDYLDPVNDTQGQSIDRKDTRVEGHARADYIVPSKFLDLYVEATIDEVDSNIDYIDYVDVRFMLGAILSY